MLFHSHHETGSIPSGADRLRPRGIHHNRLLISPRAPEHWGAAPSQGDTQSQVPLQVITSHSSPAPASCSPAFSVASASVLLNPRAEPFVCSLCFFSAFPKCLFISPHPFRRLSPASAWAPGSSGSAKRAAQNVLIKSYWRRFDAALVCAWKHITPAPREKPRPRKKKPWIDG